jgi:D-glycero-alpha-D-manno-heptose-7-phosphate kinase
MSEFYLKHGGAVVSFAINKFITIMVNPKFDGGVRVSYSITENVDEPEQLKHDIVREMLKEYMTRSCEVVSVSDIPGQGSGLGSSSSFAVGLDLAMRRHIGISVNVHPGYFAEHAYKVERFLCQHPVGKQDHYAAAYGGLHYYHFNQDESVTVEPITLSENNRRLMVYNMLLFWVGKTRQADTILLEQAKRLQDSKSAKANAMQMMTDAMALQASINNNDISSIGEYLHDNWMMKKELASGISNPIIDEYYQKAMDAGASGGKLCGAGGSGFLLFYADPHYHQAIEKALGLRRVMFDICDEGSKVIYEDNHV